jgi:hypothetical protein
MSKREALSQAIHDLVHVPNASQPPEGQTQTLRCLGFNRGAFTHGFCNFLKSRSILCTVPVRFVERSVGIPELDPYCDQGLDSVALRFQYQDDTGEYVAVGMLHCL